MALHDFTVLKDGNNIVINGHSYNQDGVYVSVVKHYYDSKEDVALFDIGFMKEGCHDILGYRLKQTYSPNVASKVSKQFAKMAGNIEIKETYIKQTV